MADIFLINSSKIIDTLTQFQSKNQPFIQGVYISNNEGKILCKIVQNEGVCECLSVLYGDANQIANTDEQSENNQYQVQLEAQIVEVGNELWITCPFRNLFQIGIIMKGDYDLLGKGLKLADNLKQMISLIVK